uniref:adenosine deaminase n=1 Tax=Saccoglossus kowalevskii TaxID=10224 RepID=A0ABM0M424_SACKO|nr:PREDICTED: adenosine deaminase-like [Saccoglossus kowalevskii]
MAASSVTKFRVELHCHLDGSIRVSSLYELAKKRGSPYGQKPFEEFKNDVTYTEIGNLTKFLKTFKIFIPWIVGDREFIKRMAYELCEDKANQGVAYIEMRYCPHFFASAKVAELKRVDGDLTPHGVVQCVNEGLKEGCKDFGITAKSILCCMRGFSAWSPQIIELCKEFHNDTVVGIDLAGDEDLPLTDEAVRCGIHRTVHAGESGPSAHVKTAIDVMKAERIGHGYHVLEDEKLYERVLEDQIHFEVCPMSSYYLSSAGTENFRKHPAVRFAKDNLNFSFNTDDESIFETSLPNEFNVGYNKMGLSEAVLTKLVFNAARSSFLPENEKLDLIRHLQGVYGMTNNVNTSQCNTL